MLEDIVKYLGEHERIDGFFNECTGRGVTVAVLDSGIDATHPALEGKVISSVTFSQKGRGIARSILPPSDNDKSGHGTGAAGILSTVAPDAKIVDIKVLNDLAVGSFRVMSEGLQYAIEQNIGLVNMGLGVRQEKFIVPILNLVQEANRRNIIIVASSDNKGKTIYPAALPGVISVELGEAAGLQDIRRGTGSAMFGGYGAGIRTCGLGHSYVRQTGTSFAAAHICGVVALLLEKWPGLALHEIEFVLSRYARPNTMNQDDIRRHAYSEMKKETAGSETED